LGKEHWVIAGLAFLGIFVFDLPYPLIVVIAGLFGFFRVKQNMDIDSENIQLTSVSLRQTFKVIILWLAVWFVPLGFIGWLTDRGLLYDIGVFFSKLATVTFGGAYAVLAYMSQEVVFDLKWLTTAQMMDGLGLAETTPGPLILVTQFVGFMAGFQEGGLILAVAGAILALWVTFVPCFLWIFTGAPYIEWIVAQPRLRNVLSTITAAVVGVILSLSLWFGLHVLFVEVSRNKFWFMNIWQPDVSSINVLVLIFSILSYYLLIIRHINIIYVLGICSLLGVLTSFFIQS
jgi:chromate transporter